MTGYTCAVSPSGCVISYCLMANYYCTNRSHTPRYAQRLEGKYGNTTVQLYRPNIKTQIPHQNNDTAETVHRRSAPSISLDSRFRIDPKSSVIRSQEEYCHKNNISKVCKRIQRAQYVARIRLNMGGGVWTNDSYRKEALAPLFWTKK